jgi:beta-lactamase superfamily II metal-dependent hydrolase
MSLCELVEIRVLNIKDADAIIVVLKKNESFLVVLIDAGRNYHYKKIDAELSEILSTTKKAAPDLIICTHYDYDHIGGLDRLIDIYGQKIGEVWMHKTSEIIELADKISIDYEKSGFLPDEASELLAIEYGTGIVTPDDEDIQIVLRQLKHEVEILKKLRKIIEPKEPIYNHCTLEGWPEIKVMGPTKEYYKTLFPDHFDVKEFLNLELGELKNNKDDLGNDSEKSALIKLDQFKRAALSPANLNSAIIMIETDKGKLLFSGDAGIESFKNIPNYKTELKNIEWLKVPHHGSANNLDRELIELMRPKYAFISGKTHVSSIVVEALKEVDSKVYITSQQNKTLVFPVS